MTGVTVTTWPPLTSHEVCCLLSLTYRQLDHVSRTVFADTPGSGNHRRWDDQTLDRLTVAKALCDAIPFNISGHSPWPTVVEAALAGPVPVPGWVTLAADRTVTYHGPVAPLGEVGISARWRPVRRSVT
jgi:hypothetical protein